jgi:hypothetical protein
MTHVLSTAARPARPKRRFPLWIPLLLVWLLLLPIVLLLAPLVFAACLVMGVNPFRGVAVYWQLFNALRGVRVAVEDPQAPVSFRIF